MFDIGWTELLVIGIVALIVIGPRDLPGMFHTMGRFMAKARKMAREFSNAMEDAAKEAGVDDVAKDFKDMTSVKNLGLDKVKEAATRFENWEPMDSVKKTPKGPETQALSPERAEAARKIREATARAASERQAADGAADAPADKPTAKKAAKKPAARKPATRKPATKKPAAKKAPAKKPAAKKPASGTTRKASSK